MILGIRPTVDFAFKLMLGSPDHTAVTVHFLNAVLGGSPRITRATILNPILGKETDEDKLAILDVRAEDELGRQFNVEMQTSLAAGLSKRLVYYASCLYVEQLFEGISYVSLRPAISICVLERALFPHEPRLHLDFQLRDSAGLLLTDCLQIHLIELPKSQTTAHNIAVVSPLERWAFFLKHADQLDAATIRALLPEPEFIEALGVLEMIARTPEQSRLYDARLKLQLDEAAKLEYATEQGRLQGRLEGEHIGQMRGEHIGQMRGEHIGQIRLLEQILKLQPTSIEELAKLSIDELAKKTAELQGRLK